MRKNITKADIVNTIAGSTGLTKIDTKAVLEGVISTVVDAISKGHKVEIRGFGVFHSKKRKAKLARNPKTGKLIPIAEKFVPLFRASGEFAKKVNAVRYPDSQSKNIETKNTDVSGYIDSYTNIIK
jgi:DNA-binding protein HU-beta